MIGNGVEFSERNTIWLAKNLGIIRDKLEHRWSGQDWEEFSTIEYLESSSEDDFLGRMFGGYKVLDVNDFENEPSLNNDPFRPNYPTAIIQRSRVHYDQ